MDTQYKVWKLPHPMLLHWILNPGLAINEIVLGQRVPKISLIDETSDAPLMERTFVKCPHCETLHNGKLWGKGNALWHYTGYYCLTCEEKIPTLLNIFSILILILTFPIWKPLQMIFGERFKNWELDRLRIVAQTTAVEPIKFSGIKAGVFFGGFMGVFFLLQRVGGGLTRAETISVIIAAIVAGLLFGGIMSLFLLRRGKSKAAETLND